MRNLTPRLRTLTLLAKFALAGVILTYLILLVIRNESFTPLLDQEKDWSRLAIGVGCILTGACICILRWHILVRALELPFRVIDAMRLGALGFALNFVAPGSVGGDVFKAIFIAQGQPGRRTEAVATVALDRVVGLFSKLLIASGVVLLMDFEIGNSTAIVVLSRGTLLCTVAALVGAVLALYVPGITSQSSVTFAGRVPLIGAIVASLLAALQGYRERKWRLVQALLFSLVADAFFITSFFFIASGLPLHCPTLMEHSFVVPLAAVAGGLPLTPSGLGTMEAAVEALYAAVPSGSDIVAGTGTIVALAHRLGMIVCAVIGLGFYVTQRAEVRQAMQESDRSTATVAGR